MKFGKKLPLILLLVICVFAGWRQADAELKFEEERSTHFIIYYQPGVDRDFIDEIVKAAENYYNEIADNLGFRRFDFWLWEDRAKLYIFATKSQFQSETGQPEWSGGCAFYSAKTIWTYPHAVGFFDSLLPHELGHIVFREFVGFGKNIPLWFEEGVASYQEKSKRFALSQTMRDIDAKQQVLEYAQIASVASPNDLRGNSFVEIFYTQSISMVDFLISHFGKDKFVSLCQALKEGASFDQALAKTYYELKNAKDFYQMWRAVLAENKQ